MGEANNTPPFFKSGAVLDVVGGSTPLCAFRRFSVGSPSLRRLVSHNTDLEGYVAQSDSFEGAIALILSWGRGNNV